MPKLALHQITDLDKLRVSRSLDTEELAGRVYSELDDKYKQRFLNYQLSADLFVAATPREIREELRRIDSYTVSLNPKEQAGGPARRT